MVFAVSAFVHFPAGVDIQIPAGLGAAQAARPERNGDISAVEAVLAQAVPALVVLDHPDGLHTVAFAGVALPEDKEIVSFSRKEPAPLGQLKGNRPAGLELEGTAVVLHNDLVALASQILHPRQAASAILEQIGGYSRGPVAVIPIEVIVGLCRCPRRESGGDQRQQQRHCANGG